MASSHAAAVCHNVSSLELPFDPDGSRKHYGEPIEDGYIQLPHSPGWGIQL